jgi:hypothetical protein
MHSLSKQLIQVHLSGESDMAKIALTPDYDSGADVLYLTLLDAPESDCEDTPEGVTLRFSAQSRVPIGAIVVGYEQYGWPAKSTELVQIVSKHLSIPPSEIKKALNHIG